MHGLGVSHHQQVTMFSVSWSPLLALHRLKERLAQGPMGRIQTRIAGPSLTATRPGRTRLAAEKKNWDSKRSGAAQTGCWKRSRYVDRQPDFKLSPVSRYAGNGGAQDNYLDGSRDGFRPAGRSYMREGARRPNRPSAPRGWNSKV